MLRAKQFCMSSDQESSESGREGFIHIDRDHRIIKIGAPQVPAIPLKEKPMKRYELLSDSYSASFSLTSSNESTPIQFTAPAIPPESIPEEIPERLPSHPYIPSLATIYLHNKQRQASKHKKQRRASNLLIPSLQSEPQPRIGGIITETLGPERSPYFPEPQRSPHFPEIDRGQKSANNIDLPKNAENLDHGNNNYSSPKVLTVHQQREINIEYRAPQKQPCPLCGSTSGTVNDNKLIDIANGLALGSMRKMRAIRRGNGALENLHSLLNKAK